MLQLLKLPDQTVRVLVEGKSRARVTRFTDREDFFQADAHVIADATGDRRSRGVDPHGQDQFEQYIKLNKKVSRRDAGIVAQIDDSAKLADTVASHLSVKIADQQTLLETLNTRRAAGEGSRA